MVGVRGFEPPTPSSRTMCATRLRYTPTWPHKTARRLYTGDRAAAQAAFPPKANERKRDLLRLKHILCL
jgi:hypothetical protein